MVPTSKQLKDESFDQMTQRRRKLVLLLFALLVIAVIAIGVNYYVWHQMRLSRNAADVSSQLSDPKSASITNISNPESNLVAAFDTQMMTSPPTRLGESNQQIDQHGVPADDDIQRMIYEALRNDFPELNLSQRELLELTETILLLRQTLFDLRKMDRA